MFKVLRGAAYRRSYLMDNAIGIYKLGVDKSRINQPLYQPGPIAVGPPPAAAKPTSGASV
jgi:hypothetical protein